MKCGTITHMHRFTQHLRNLGNSLRNPAPGLEWFTAAGVLLFGLLFIVIVPPMQGADESNHFLRAYQISEGNLVSDYVGQSQGGIATHLQSFDRNVGGELPSGIVAFTFEAFGRIPQHGDQKMTRSDFARLRAHNAGEGRTAAAFGNTAAYSPVSYAPQVAAIGVGRLFHASPLMLMYLARLASLAFGVMMLFFILRIMPFGKLPLAVIALLPMTVSQFAIVTADTTAITFGFLAVATTLRFAYRKQDVSPPEVVSLLAIFAVIGFVKPALLPLGLVGLLLLKNQLVRRRKALLMTVGCLLATLICGAAWNLLVKDIVIFGFHMSYPHNDYAAQLSYILHQPLQYVGVLLNTFLTSNLNYVPTSFIGYFGWADTPMPLMGVVAGFSLVSLATFISSLHENVNLPRPVRWLAATALLGVTIFTATYMYLFCNAPKDTFIVGIQGRYFIPALALLPLLFLGAKKVLSRTLYETYTRRCLIGSLVLLFVMTCVTLARYYNLPHLL